MLWGKNLTVLAREANARLGHMVQVAAKHPSDEKLVALDDAKRAVIALRKLLIAQSHAKARRRKGKM